MKRTINRGQEEKKRILRKMFGMSLMTSFNSMINLLSLEMILKEQIIK